MKITKSDYEKLNSKLSELETSLNGGKGSGNFGHSGRKGKVGGSGSGQGFSKGQKVTFEGAYGEPVEGTITRKLTDKEKQDRAHLANPDAGDYYEVEYGKGDFAGKTILWEARIKPSKKEGKEISVKDVQKALQPSHDRYTREVTEVKYNPEKDNYEAKATVHFKDKTPDEKEDWFTLEGKDPKDKMSWLKDNSPTFLEEFAERMDRVHGGKSNNGIEKKMIKLSKEDCEELKNKLENLEKLLNGGKGSGNFGHSGRPGKRGGSGGGKGGKYSVGDTFEKDGETFTVEEDGRGGKEGVSADRKVVTTTPDDYAKMRGGMQSDRLSQVGAPKGVTEEVDRLYKKIEDEDAEGADSYLETAVGALSGWAEGNGGTAKPQSDAVKEKINDVITDMVLDTIDVDYKARGQKMDDIVSKIGDKIYETGDEYICPKKEMIDGIKGSIKILHDDYPDINDFKEQASGTIEDLRDVMKMSPKSYVSVSEHPMSASGLVYRELSKEDADTISEQRRKEKDAAAAFWR